MLGDINLPAIFTTGLLAGGISCMAVQGGLLVTTIASRKSVHIKDVSRSEISFLKRLIQKGDFFPILSFLVAKLAAYTILGAILGFLGQRMQLTLPLRVSVQITVGIFMLGIALNMLGVHPIFRYFVIQPPRFLTKYIRNQSKRGDLYSPAILGAFTIFIPCGVTQAMMALAVGAANPILGALIMFAFILGTTPLFFILGYLTMKIGDVMKSGFNRFASVIIVLFAILTLNSAIALTGSLWTLENAWNNFYCFVGFCKEDFSTVFSPVTEQTITFSENGYFPNKFTVKSGTRVTLNLKNQGGGGCVQAFTIPTLNIQKIVPVGKSEILTFTAPNKPGKISFMCSMGMYSGVIEVI